MPAGYMTMATMRGKKDRSVKDMLTKPPGGRAEGETPGPGQHLDKEAGEDERTPVTRGFLEGLLASLRDDIQTVKKDLLQDLKVMRWELEEVGERVASLEEHENTRGEEVEQLHQEILRLQAPQIELQAHAEDFENRSRRNNIRIWGAPTGTEEGDIHSFVQALFHQILGESTERERVRDRPEVTGVSFRGEAYTIALYADDVVVTLDDPVKALPVFLEDVEAFGVV
ncbi:hypothetical protein NDU88_001105 [Pleurodeles waltl]|uniref:Reverse transcriptase domain-containing protein n=1 Tax=Pleurodeles waltl TaxID=8319 RepID=A0AAV7R825_PLEWA|nr:hypothetical protein NDU88_001105 [Pleurodeles waltl]